MAAMSGAIMLGVPTPSGPADALLAVPDSPGLHFSHRPLRTVRGSAPGARTGFTMADAAADDAEREARHWAAGAELFGRALAR